MAKKVMIVVGGTGGHIYPGLSLAEELSKANPEIKLMFVGGNLNNNRYFDQGLNLHKSVECGPMSSKNPFKILKNLKKILKGIWQSRSIIKSFKPDLIVGFGSYYTFPTLVAAKFSKVPIILHEANSIPGKVNRLLSRHALKTGISFPDAAFHLKGETVEVSMPIRSGYALEAVAKEEALDYFSLAKNKTTILVFGGSQGAKKLNDLVSEAICSHFEGKKDQIQLLHFCGKTTSVKELEEMYALNGIVASVKEFEKRMDFAYRVADLLISRAGASTIAEEIEFEVPGILIPYPYSSEGHQEKNAAFMAKNGGALMFLEKDLDAEKLGKKISTMLNHDRILLRTMKEALRQYKTVINQKKLSHLVLEHL